MLNQLRDPAPSMPTRGWPSRVGGDHREVELDRLRKRVDQQEHTLTALTEAISVLRRGNRALRDENRELRLQLQKTSHPRAPGKEPR